MVSPCGVVIADAVEISLFYYSHSILGALKIYPL